MQIAMRKWRCSNGGYIGAVGCFRAIDMKHLSRQQDVSCLKTPCGQKAKSKMSMFTRFRVYGLGSSQKNKICGLRSYCASCKLLHIGSGSFQESVE